MPDICLGSGIWNCAESGTDQSRANASSEEEQLHPTVSPVSSVMASSACFTSFCPQRLQNRASASLAVPHDPHGLGDGLGGRHRSSRFVKISLDLIAVVWRLRRAVASSEPRAPEAGRTSLASRLPTASHRAIELELLDRPQRQHLSRSSATPVRRPHHRGPVVFRGNQRTQHAEAPQGRPGAVAAISTVSRITAVRPWPRVAEQRGGRRPKRRQH